MSFQPVALQKTVRLTETDLTRPMSHAVRFYAAAFKSILGPHRLLLKDSPIYWSPFHFCESQKQQWMRTFGVETHHSVPFTYANQAATMSLMRIIADQGINFKYVRHLKSELSFPRSEMQTDTIYRVSTELQDVLALGDDRAALVTETIVYTEDHGVCHVQRDYWIVLNLSQDDVKRIRTQQGFRWRDDGEFHQLTKRKPALTEEVRPVEMLVPHNMGWEYGKLSGDFNPTHLSPLAAKLFANSRPFIQGFCTVNYLIKLLCERIDRPLRSLQVTLIRPIYTGERIVFRFSTKEFEVCNEGNELLASGSWLAF